MEKKLSFSEVLKKYTMVIVLVLVVIMFTANTKGVMLLPQNVNNLVAQNAYVFILATGMLFCILTGGNIDLSVGSVVCFVAAVGGKMMVLNNMNPYLTMIKIELPFRRKILSLGEFLNRSILITLKEPML